MRIIPRRKYIGEPCPYVATACAYEDLCKKDYTEKLPEHLRDDGWSTLDNMNKYVRQVLPVKKKVYYKRNERKTLAEFLIDNDTKCIVCVLGHFIYVNGRDYWSFFENGNDLVVCVWYLK